MSVVQVLSGNSSSLQNKFLSVVQLCGCYLLTLAAEKLLLPSRDRSYKISAQLLSDNQSFIKLEFDAEPVCCLGCLIASRNKVLRAIPRFRAPPQNCRKCKIVLFSRYLPNATTHSNSASSNWKPMPWLPENIKNIRECCPRTSVAVRGVQKAGIIVKIKHAISFERVRSRPCRLLFHYASWPVCVESIRRKTAPDHWNTFKSRFG